MRLYALFVLYAERPPCRAGVHIVFTHNLALLTGSDYMRITYPENL